MRRSAPRQAPVRCSQFVPICTRAENGANVRYFVPSAPESRWLSSTPCSEAKSVDHFSWIMCLAYRSAITVTTD